MWNDIATPLKDDGVETVRRYLVESKGMKNAQCVLYNGNLRALANRQQSFHLYVVAHGCENEAAMTSDDHVVGEKKDWS
ncbi:MAG: hypothetical protein ACT4P7_10400 [Gemmatimonadaceae bacterium]